MSIEENKTNSAEWRKNNIIEMLNDLQSDIDILQERADKFRNALKDMQTEKEIDDYLEKNDFEGGLKHIAFFKEDSLMYEKEFQDLVEKAGEGKSDIHTKYFAEIEEYKKKIEDLERRISSLQNDHNMLAQMNSNLANENDLLQRDKERFLKIIETLVQIRKEN